MNKNQLIHSTFEVTVMAKGLAAFFEIIGGLTVWQLSSKHFITAYLLFYGAVNLFLVIFLLRNKLWAYPTAMICFSLFTAYMFVRFLHTHSLILLAFAVYDVFLIILISLEYQRLKKAHGSHIN